MAKIKVKQIASTIDRPKHQKRVIDGLARFIDSNSQHVWQDEYRFKKADGKYVLVSDRGFLIYNQMGKVSRMVGFVGDLFATHPPMALRVARLRAMAYQSAKASGDLAPE